MSSVSTIIQSISKVIEQAQSPEKKEGVKYAASAKKDSVATFGGRAEPYPGVPTCDVMGRGNYYWIFKAKKGGWRLSANSSPFMASLYRDPLPNEAPELLKRYQPRFKRALIFNHDTTPAGIVKTMQEHFETITMLARSGVCQAAWPDEKTCTSKDVTSCKKKYVLLFKHALNGHTMTELAQQKITNDYEESQRQQAQMVKTMPPSVRKCYFPVDTSAAREVYKRNAEKYGDIEAANTDWTTIEAVTGEVMRDIDKELPALDEERRRYVMKVIKVGQEAGMGDRELKEVVYDVSMVSAGDEPFIRALETVASLKFARMLHVEHKRKGGRGISEDFERFVGVSIDNVRSGRITFSVMNLQNQMDQAGATYSPWSNTVNFAPLCAHADPIGKLSTVVHEMYHSYQDFMKRTHSNLDNEAEAYERDMKTDILLGRYRANEPEELPHIPEYEDISWIQEDKLKSQMLNAVCMGTTKEFLESKDAELWGSTLYSSALSGFDDELHGIASPYARDLIKERVLSHETQRLFNRTLDDSYRPAWLHDHGYNKVLVDLFESSDDDATAIGGLLNRAIADKAVPDKVRAWLNHGAVRAFALASSALYYMTSYSGQPRDNNSLKLWRDYNERLGRRYGDALEELEKNRKAFNDGVE